MHMHPRANWMFRVGEYNATTHNFSFGHGGFQGARGENSGGDWFVENVTSARRSIM